MTALLALLPAAAARGQDWRLLGDPFVAAMHGAFDDVRHRLVAVGAGRETREWNGNRWLHRPVSLLPDLPGALVFDSARGVVVALIRPTASSGSLLLETFEFDGNAWTRRASAGPAPSSLLMGPAVFDSVRGRTVFVATSSLGPRQETWEWDGAGWTLASTALPPRFLPALAFDRARGRTVLFGGGDPLNLFGSAFAETWEWNGATWMLRALPAAPSARLGASMTFDSRRSVCVLFGNGPTPDTWEYDGTAWTRWSQPAPRTRGRVVYDGHRDRIVLIGGDVLSADQDVWEWDGATWTQRFATSLPIPHLAPGTAYSAARDRLVLFGGDLSGTAAASETWEWDGAGWLLRTPATAPPGRSFHGMWSDGIDVFLFGGITAANQLLDDTWRFDGTNWSQVATAQRPAARQYAAVAFDPTSGGALLFGGRAGPSSFLGDTWRLTAAGWSQVATATAPTARAGSAIAGDRTRGTVLLWGGADSTGARGDTWSWNGANWQMLAPANSPAPDANRTMAYEPTTGLIVLAAKPATIGARLETWVWDGGDWTRLDAAARVGLPLWPSVSAAPGRVRLYDGDLYELTLRPPEATAYGAGCPTVSLQLRADDWPRPGTNLSLSSSGHPAAAPVLLVLGLSSATTPVAGCTLLVQPAVPSFASADGSGNCAWPLPIPPQPALVGVHVFAQAWSLGPGGVQATNGVGLTIGR